MTDDFGITGLLGLVVAVPLIGITLKQISKIGEDLDVKQNKKGVEDA